MIPKLKKNLLILFILGTCSLFAQDGSKSIWTKVSKSNFNQTLKKKSYPKNAAVYQLNVTAILDKLKNVPSRTNMLAKNSSIIIQFPNSKGVMELFSIVEASTMEPELQAQYPNIRSFAGQGITNPSSTIRFSISHQVGLSAYERSVEYGSSFIEGYDLSNNVYVVYNRENAIKSQFSCETEVDFSENIYNKYSNTNVTKDADTGKLSTFRLALSCTGEYGAGVGGGTLAGVLAQFNATMTRVNGVFENDFALTLVMIANEASIIYFDAATDPYSGDLKAALQTNLTAVIGEANYDIGHIFNQANGGGNAGCIGCVCSDGTKGRGFTQSNNPTGDNFDIDFVTHEMAHQLGATHTHSHLGVEGYNTQVEPGTGSTIMGYAGLSVSYSVELHSDDNFSYKNIIQVTNNIVGKCQTITNFANQAPTSNAGANYTIPVGTAFKLTGAGNDINAGDVLSYSWEQADNATVTDIGAYPNGDIITGPSFRCYPPTANPVRYFPRKDYVYAGNLIRANNTPGPGGQWESLSNNPRTYNFALIVRDNVVNAGQNDIDQTLITVANQGGVFAVTSQTTATTLFEGDSELITWDVAGTDGGAINSPNVNILFTTDQGQTFTNVLMNTPNDGNQVISVPAVATTTGRFVVESINNIFYAVNSADLTIQTSKIVMAFADADITICEPNDAVYNFTYKNYLGYAGTTTFSATGLPTGASVVFNPTTATANNTAVTMTISGIATANIGQHTITVTGTGIPTSILKNKDVVLNVFGPAIATPILNSPSNNTVGTMIGDPLVWNTDVNVVSYDVTLYSDAALTTQVETKNVTTTSYVPTATVINTQYWWTVTANNMCGTAVTTAPFTFTIVDIGCNTVASTSAPITISGTEKSTLTSTLYYSNVSVVTDVNVTINIAHVWDADLDISLKSPAGTVIDLSSDNGSNGDNYTNTVFDDAGADGPIVWGTPPYTGTFVPEQLLSTLNGESSQGNWTLTVHDDGAADGGQFISWSLNICGALPLSVIDNDFAQFNIYPNPTNGNVNIVLSTDKNVQIALFDISGRKVYEKQYENKLTTFTESINFRTMASGVYLLNVVSGTKQATKKLVIQ